MIQPRHLAMTAALAAGSFGVAHNGAEMIGCESDIEFGRAAFAAECAGEIAEPFDTVQQTAGALALGSFGVHVMAMTPIIAEEVARRRGVEGFDRSASIGPSVGSSI